MAWTQNRIRSRTSLRRHRPGLEHLDERCLLSTSAGVSPPHQAISHPHAAAFQARIQPRASLHDHGVSRSSPNQVVTVQTAPPATPLERPAGTLLTGTPTAFDPIVGAAAARAAHGVDGTGMTVAVIDTGVDYNNPALGGRFGPGAKVIAGYNFATSSPDPMATTSQHGTAVAGLIGSSDPNHLGVAPGVQIVALRVTGNDNTADLSSVARALQWVIDHHGQYNITAVNMSLSDGGNYAHNWFAQDGGVGQQVTGLIGQLKALNIPVVAATGNSFAGQQGEGFTSVVDGVISVTATDTSDHLLSNAQRLGSTIGMGTMTDVAALGEGMLAPSGDSGYSIVEGTSFATPLVSGAVVLLQQIYQARFGALPTVDQVTQWLEKGSDPIYDPVTGLTIGRLDIPKAAGLIASPTSSPAPTAASLPAIVSISTTQTATWSTSTATPVSYVPATVTPPPAVTPPAAAATTPSVPPVQPPVVPKATPAPAQPGLSPDVQVFVNGKQVNSLAGSQSSMLPTLPRDNFDSLLKAMSDWAAGTGSGQVASTGVSQVRIWNAPSQAANGLAPVGSIFPVGATSR
jgi:type VI secretion system secreted protein VgrG